MSITTKLDRNSQSGAMGERPCYVCPRCGVTYDAAIGDPAPECDCDEDALTINGYRIQTDASGQGHAWRDVRAESTEGGCREEIECWIIEDKPGDHDVLIAQNGLRYRAVKCIETAAVEAMEALCMEIADESERQVVSRLGYDPGRDGWYYGGSSHNDYRLSAEISGGQIVVSDGNASEPYTGTASTDDIKTYVAEWLDMTMQDGVE